MFSSRKLLKGLRVRIERGFRAQLTSGFMRFELQEGQARVDVGQICFASRKSTTNACEVFYIL